MTQFGYVLHAADFFCKWGMCSYSSYFKQTPQQGRSAVFGALCPCAWPGYLIFWVIATGEMREGKRESKHSKLSHRQGGETHKELKAVFSSVVVTLQL